MVLKEQIMSDRRCLFKDSQRRKLYTFGELAN